MGKYMTKDLFILHCNAASYVANILIIFWYNSMQHTAQVKKMKVLFPDIAWTGGLPKMLDLGYFY